MYDTSKITITYSPSVFSTVLLSVGYLIGSFLIFITSKTFDFVTLLISLCFAILFSMIHYLVLISIYNNNILLKARYNLYVTIKNKTDISKTIENIIASRNINVFKNINIFCSELDTNLIEDKIKKNTLVDYLIENHYDNKNIKKIKNELKMYNFKDDLIDLIIQFESKELIKKQNFNIGSVLITVISFILAILCFFKIDFFTITMTLQLILLSLYFITMTISTISEYKGYLKLLNFTYFLINEILKKESFDVVTNNELAILNNFKKENN